MSELSIFKLDSQTITIKDTTARQTAESAKALATAASDNATTALNKVNELPFVTPEQFGAKGDGETDDTQALNDALTYCHENKCGLYAKAGTYIYNGALEYGNITLIGDGIGKTIFKLKDNCDITSGRFITGFSVKPNLTDIESVIFRDFEIDGNATNNRHWTSTAYGSWRAMQDLTQCNGIRTEPNDLGGGTSNYAQYIEISGLYVHDTIRDNIVVVSDGVAIIKDCIFENSDTDHLLYLQTLTGDVFVNNCVLRGYAKGHIQSAKAIFNGIIFEDIKLNPAIANLTTSERFALFTPIDRSAYGQKTGIKINNVFANLDLSEFVSNFYFDFISANSFVEANNCYIDINDTGQFDFFYADGNTSTADTPKVGIKADNIILRNLSNKTRIFALAHDCDRLVSMSNSFIQFATKPTARGIIELFGGASVKGVQLNNIMSEKVCNLVRIITAVSSDNTGLIIVNDSHIDVNTDNYIIDGNTGFDGLLQLNNVSVDKFRYNSARPYVHYNNVYSLTDGDIKYLATAPESGNRVGDSWYYQGSLKFWNGSAWATT